MQTVEALSKAKKSYASFTKDIKLGEEKLHKLEIAVEEYERQLSEKKEKEKESIFGLMLSAFDTLPAVEREKQLMRLSTLRNHVVIARDEITLQKFNLLNRITARDLSFDEVVYIIFAM